jgi:hypothetical protein
MTESAPKTVAMNITDNFHGGSQVGVIAKRTYHVQGARCVPADEQVALVEVPRVAEDHSAMLHDVDISLNRALVDAIVTAKAYPPHPGTTRFDVSVRIGALERRLLAIGDRSSGAGSGTAIRPAPSLPRSCWFFWGTCRGPGRSGVSP